MDVLSIVGERDGVFWEEWRRSNNGDQTKGQVVFEVFRRLGKEATNEFRFGGEGFVGDGKRDGFLTV